MVKEGGSTGGRINFPYSRGVPFFISQEDEQSGSTCFCKRFCLYHGPGGYRDRVRGRKSYVRAYSSITLFVGGYSRELAAQKLKKCFFSTLCTCTHVFRWVGNKTRGIFSTEEYLDEWEGEGWEWVVRMLASSRRCIIPPRLSVVEDLIFLLWHVFYELSLLYECMRPFRWSMALFRNLFYVSFPRAIFPLAVGRHIIHASKSTPFTSIIPQ